MKPNHSRRIRKLRQVFLEKKLDGVFINSHKDIFYYTGKNISRTDPGFLLVTKGKHTLFVSTLNNMLEGPGVKVLTNFNVLKKELNAAGKLGFDDKNLSYLLFKRFGSSTWKPISDSLKSIRAVKDSYEISQLKNAATSTLKILNSLKLKGKSELDVVSDIHYKIRSSGDGPAFDPIVSSGSNSYKVHYFPSNTKITRGLVIVDMGVSRNYYHSDLTRTFLINPTSRERKLQEQCQEVQRELIGMAVPGTRFSDIQKRYDQLLKSLGFPVLHCFGHGVGLSVHERPTGNDILEKDMVLTVEPGFYKKGLGGCRIEDMVLVREKPLVLSK